MPELALAEADGVVKIAGADFSMAFNRSAGILTSWKFGGRELLATNVLSSPRLQLFRAPTDNDNGFGKWRARDWRESGLSNLVRQVASFQIERTANGGAKIVVVETNFAVIGGCKLKTAWIPSRDGSLEMENEFTPFGELPLLPKVGIVMGLTRDFENVRWLGRGPWENYSDRKTNADFGVWSRTTTEQYVPYIRPQETGNKEDVRWLELTDAHGDEIKISAMQNPFSFSALHFTANDLASVRHNYELQPRPEIILSLDAKMSGLGNSSCGPGVLARYAVSPAESYRLHLRFRPCQQAHSQ